MFKPYMIPALGKTHDLIVGHNKFIFVDTLGNETVGHFRGYANSDGSLEDATVRVTSGIVEAEYTLSFLVDLVHQGLLGKFRD